MLNPRVDSQNPVTGGFRRFAYQILREFGNMSSVTVLFVLQKLLSELKPENKDEHVLSFAFGPGLTMEAMLLKICHV